MDLNSISLQQVLQWLFSTGASGGVIILILRFFGNKIFNQSVVDVISSEYEKNLKAKISLDVDTKITNRLESSESSMSKEFDKTLENYATKWKSENLEINDNRYLLRQEFKMYLDNQSNQNERVENLISDLRSVCDQILLKLTK